MLLARMDSHPEEFTFSFGPEVTDTSRWWHIMKRILARVQLGGPTDSSPPAMPFLSDEEVRAVYDKYANMQGDAFTQYMMRALLKSDEKEEEDAWPHLHVAPWTGQVITHTNTASAAATAPTSKRVTLQMQPGQKWVVTDAHGNTINTGVMA